MIELRGLGIRVKFDNRDIYKLGWKFNEYELKGVFVCIVIGLKDVENGMVEVVCCDIFLKEMMKKEDVVSKIKDLFEEVQKNLYIKVIDFRKENIIEVVFYIEFKEVFDSKGGFIFVYWDGIFEIEE